MATKQKSAISNRPLTEEESVRIRKSIEEDRLRIAILHENNKNCGRVTCKQCNPAGGKRSGIRNSY